MDVESSQGKIDTGRADTGRGDAGRGDALALALMGMARDEISARMSTTTQILAFYVGAVGGIGSWVFATTGGHREAMAEILFPMSVVVAFFSFAASWIIQHGERMVNALALYQKQVIAPHWAGVAPRLTLWECSDELGRSDRGLAVRISMAVWAMIVCGPDVAAIGAMVWAKGGPWRAMGEFHWMCLGLTCVLTLCSLGLTLMQIVQREILRGDRRPSKSGLLKRLGLAG